MHNCPFIGKRVEFVACMGGKANADSGRLIQVSQARRGTEATGPNGGHNEFLRAPAKKATPANSETPAMARTIPGQPQEGNRDWAKIYSTPGSSGLPRGLHYFSQASQELPKALLVV